MGEGPETPDVEGGKPFGDSALFGTRRENDQRAREDWDREVQQHAVQHALQEQEDRQHGVQLDPVEIVTPESASGSASGDPLESLPDLSGTDTGLEVLRK